jgi:hypothetical protein
MLSECWKYFQISNDGKSLITMEFPEITEPERKHILSNPKFWGIEWTGNQVFFVYQGNEGGGYDIHLPANRKELTNQACHLAEKTWIHPEAVFEFIQLVECLFHDLRIIDS